MHVDRPIEPLQFFAPRKIHQLLARKDPAGMPGKGQQQIELIGGQDFLFAINPHRARSGIDLEPAEAQPGLVPFWIAPPPQDRLEPRQQLARVERLGQIIIGAEFEPDNPVGVLAARGQHQDRHVALRAQAAADFEPIDIGQHDIEDDGAIGPITDYRLDPRRAAMASLDHKPALGQIVAQHVGEADIVIDDQYRVGHQRVLLPRMGEKGRLRPCS